MLATLVFTTNNVPHTTLSPPTSHFHHINSPNEHLSIVWACIYFFDVFLKFLLLILAISAPITNPTTHLEIVARYDIYDVYIVKKLKT